MEFAKSEDFGTVRESDGKMWSGNRSNIRK
jgi:hypothetical protein